MPKEVYGNSDEVAKRAATDTISTLLNAIRKKGSATWVLAGGSSPMAAYKIIAIEYAHALDWSKVTILIGDERCVPLNHPDSNWGQISKILFANDSIAKANTLVPHADLGAEEGAKRYSNLVCQNIADEHENIALDLLWLGMGEDGHTLSLFPDHPALHDNSDIFIPVHDSPKPPPDRISLSLKTAVLARHITIFATGVSKQYPLSKLEHEPKSLPIGLLAFQAEQNGAYISWLSDKNAQPH